MARNAEDKDALLCGEVVFFHVSQESSRPQMSSSCVDTALQFDCETNSIYLAVIVHAELAVRCELVFLGQTAST